MKTILSAIILLICYSCLNTGSVPKYKITSVYQIEHCGTQKRDTVICVGRVIHYSKNGGYPIFCYTDTTGQDQELMNYCNAKLLKETIDELPR